MTTKGTVLVGMSGGVDSSVTAALLKRQGYDVIGMTMQIWHRSSAFEDAGAMQGCCTIDAVDDARRVAARLDIPYYVPNFREEFSATVIDDFAREYQEGRTPNPCVRCNQWVRFDGLIQRADELGVDYVATGHYARVEHDETRGEFVLRKAADPTKDQSYVLHTLRQHHLRRVLLPLGGMSKSHTRQLARDFDLPVADKPDSQEICFVAGKNYQEFLRRYVGDIDRPGDIVDDRGEAIGRHQGVHNYTVGQRRGLGIASARPKYVVELRPHDNQVVIGERDDAAGIGLVCSRLSFTGAPPADSFNAGVKIRYRTPERPATVHVGPDDTARIDFDRPVWGIAPGQLAVMYDGDRVVGGGTIDRVIKAT
ncbi:MAG: tRNA 2-thiouridine(34) synthase MnmA [Chloroflexota bacterium]|nr:MAG: tRNA 2-thiouridine(34) synthase MnmA [Chloroflexota bacterium]